MRVRCGSIGMERAAGRFFGIWILWAGIMLLSVSSVWAGWRLDGGRFLASVHGDMACQECHEGIDSLERHPDPAKVKMKAADFFNAEMCLSCHDDIRGQIEDDASHGGEDVSDPQRYFQCRECHDPHYEGAPESSAEAGAAPTENDDQTCMTCHLKVREGNAQQRAKDLEFCFVCHSTGTNMPRWVPMIDVSQYVQSPHAKLDCLTCHPQADRYEHDRQATGDCRQCHRPHPERIANEAHTQVSCEACHLNQVVPRRDPQTNQVLWTRATSAGGPTALHNFSKPDGQGCARCHFDGTTMGAAAMILPPKSVLCMPCHPATLSAGDALSVIPLVVALVGLLGFASLWFSGHSIGASGAGLFTEAKEFLHRIVGIFRRERLVPVFKAIWFDVLLQRRLYRRSVRRWTVHALIFWPFVIRFVWGVAGLFASNYLKSWPLAWALINKNHAVTAFVFDVTGICLGLGIVLALIRGSAADESRTPGLPAQDRLALGLLGGIVVVGFILEGMRIALTDAQGPAAYAFIGFGLSRLFSGMTQLSQIYGYVWYLHAIITGAFVAYLPFSRMMHIIMAPVVLAVNAGKDSNH